MTPLTSETSKMRRAAFVGTMKFVIPLLVGGGLIWQAGPRLYAAYTAKKPPTFEISAINTLQRNVYEVTNHIIGATPTDPISMNWGLQVIPHYRGNPRGEVRVLVKNTQGLALAQGQWEDFDKHSKTLSIPLSPYRLAPEVERIDLDSGFRHNIFDGATFNPPEAKFKIEIVQVNRPNPPLLTDSLILRNSPWYHYTTLSAWHDGSIDVYVHGMNVGGASDFCIVSEVFEVREVPGRPLANWPRVDAKHIIIGGIGSGHAFNATVSFPSADRFRFESGRAYCIGTFVAKKQDYAQFRDGAWQSSTDRWRLGSFSTKHLVTR